MGRFFHRPRKFGVRGTRAGRRRVRLARLLLHAAEDPTLRPQESLAHLPVHWLPSYKY